MRSCSFLLCLTILLILFLCLTKTYLYAAQETQAISIDNIESLLNVRKEAQKKIKSLLDEREAQLLYLDSKLAYKLEDEQETERLYQELLAQHKQTLNDPYTTEGQRKETLKQIVKLKFNSGKYREALSDCNKLQEQYPPDKFITELIAEACHLQANSYIQQKDYDSAISQYQSILNLKNISPNWYAFSKDYLAHLYALKGKEDEALYWYRRIIDDHKNLLNWVASAHFRLGEYYLKHKDILKAKEEFQKIVTTCPNSNWAEPAKEKLRLIK